LEEQEIILGCLQNNRFAQRYLFDRYYKRSYRIALRYLANHHDAEDVLSISFTRIFGSIRQFDYRGEGSLQKWISTIVINESIRFLKSKKFMFFTEDEALDSINVPIEEAVGELDAEEVRQVVAEMPKGYRTVFNLFAIEGFSHREIADMLQINEATSRSQLNKARNHIIQNLKKNNHAIK
jgi:RNA polymerase sigma-70 factor, ECF subfamily